MDCKKYHKTEAISNFIKKNIKREIVLIGEINNENKFFIKEIFKKNKIRNLFIEKINSKKINPSKEYVIIYNHPKWKGNLRLENTLIKNKIIYFKYNTVNLKFKKNNLLSYSLRLSRSLIQKFFDLIVLIPIKLIFLIGFFIFFKNKNKNYNLKTIKNAYKKIQYKSTKIVAILIHQNQFYQKISKICDDFNELPNQRKKIYLRQITFFSYLNFLNSQIYKSKKNKVPKKILLIKLDHLGDILHSLKSIEIIKKKYKNIKIDIIVGPWGFDLVKKTKLFNNIFIYNPKTKIFDRSLKNNNKRLSMLNEFLFFSKIAKENYDVIFDPSMPRIENIRISMLIPAKIRIGTKYKIDFPYKPWDDKSKIFKKDYESKRIINLIKPILPNKSQPIKDNNIYNIKLTKNQNPDFLKILTKINKFKTIGIAPGSPWKYRKWPELKYVKLINKIIENKYKVVLLGGKEDIQTDY